MNRYDSSLEKIMNDALSKQFRYDDDFVCQFPIRCKYGYILDFAFPKQKLAIECDGEKWHPKNNKRDERRDIVLKKRGWKVLRFTGHQITSDIDACVKEIKQEIEKEIKP